MKKPTKSRKAAPESVYETVTRADEAMGPAARWITEIEASQKDAKRTDYEAAGKRIIARYLSEGRGTLNDGVVVAPSQRMNLLWANVETLKPAIFARTPKATAQPRNRDGNPVARTAAMVLERSANALLDRQPFAMQMGCVRDDRLLPGAGTAIVEYLPETDDASVTRHNATVRHLQWRDWLTNRARSWNEVRWFAYRAYVTKPEAEKRYGAELADALAYDQIEGGDDKNGSSRPADASPGDRDKAVVWCIWSKDDNRVYHVSPGCKSKFLLEAEPPCQFTGFFPCPRPLVATVGPESTIPTADFRQYQDQANEIDMLTGRIYSLSTALRLKGLYPASANEIKRLLAENDGEVMIPVENWAQFGEQFGRTGVVSWLPIDMVAQTLTQCIAARQQAKQALYEVTGISDIVRGATSASETATAQQIKSQWGSLRIRETQREMQRFCADAIRLLVEIVAEHYTPEELAAMSGMSLLTAQQKAQIQQMQAMAAQPPMPGMPPAPPPPPIPPEVAKLLKEPTWDEVMALLRSGVLREFAIDVETDSTIEPDQREEQAARVEFVTAVTQFLTAATPVLQTAPALAPLMGELLLFGVRGFRVGAPVESEIEQAVKMIEQASERPPAPPQPDPTLEAAKVKAAAEIERAGMETQAAREEHAGTMAELAMKGRIDAMRLQQQAMQTQAPPGFLPPGLPQ